MNNRIAVYVYGPVEKGWDQSLCVNFRMIPAAEFSSGGSLKEQLLPAGCWDIGTRASCSSNGKQNFRSNYFLTDLKIGVMGGDLFLGIP